MKRRLSKVILAVFFIALFVFYYVHNPQVFSELKKYSLSIIVIGVVYNIFSIYINGLFLKFVIDTLSRKMPQEEGFYTSFLSTFGNFFLPLRGGAVLRAVYLKNKYDFSYKNFIATLYGNYIMIFLVTSSLSLALLGGFTVIAHQKVSPYLFAIMAIIFVTALSLASANFRLDQWALRQLHKVPINLVKKLVNKTDSVIEGWRIIVSHRRLFTGLLGVTLLNLFTRSIFYLILFRSLGLHVNIFQTLLFSTVTTLSIFVAVTPGSIGVRETILLIFSTTLQLTSTAILSATLVDRATQLIALVGLFVFYNFFTKRNLMKKENWM